MKKTDYNYRFHYGLQHDESEQSFKTDVASFTWFLKNHNAVPNDKNAKILEIGCAMGRMMIALQNLGYNNVLGIDADAGQINICKKHNLNAKLVDGYKFLKNTKEKFDVIYCIDLLEHIDKDKQLNFLKLLNKCLTKTGFLVLKVPNALSPTASFTRYCDFEHTTSYSDNVIYFLIKNAGFENVVSRPEYRESKRVQRLKSRYARLCKIQFNQQIILTTNIVSLVFKDKDTYENYLKTAPKIKNRYWRI